MEKWTSASNYMGEEYPEYYVLLGQHRDSHLVDQSNFSCALDRLGGESETVIVVRSGHWAVGWVESLLIHESDSEAIAEGEKIQAEIADYPVLDDSDYSDREYRRVMDYWQPASLTERMHLCADCNIPVPAARHNDAPMRYDRLYECLAE